MAREGGFEFLRLEFKELYDEISDVINSSSQDDVIDKANKILEDAIYLIYKKNKILYDGSLDNKANLKILNNINLLPDPIMKKILHLVNDFNYNYLQPKELNEDRDVVSWIHEYKKDIFEVLMWFLTSCGEENYSLILDSLNQWQKDILNKYLNTKVEPEKEIDDFDNLSIDEQKQKTTRLVEIGENYYFARGVKKNNKEALKYFLKAAKLGDEYAEAYLGMFYERGLTVKRDYLMASKWYSRAASKGNNFAQYSLGVLYLNGNGVKKDYNKAIIWLQKSAENEYAPSYYQLGRVYYNGYGVEKNYDSAFKWYEKAAEANFGAAQHALSFMYKNGEGCEQNSTKAYYWIERAAENEHEDAYYIVGKSYLEGIHYDINYEKAYFYLEKGYRELDTNCIESLGDMYFKGLYVKKDIFHALELYNKSIDYGNKALYFKIGKIYEEQGLIKQALNYYKKGHEEGYIKCTQRLGVMYYNGEGVSRDLDKAINYMEIASENKAPHAMYVLGVAYLRLNKFGEKTEEISKKLLQEAYELKSPYAAEYLAYLMLNEKREGKDIDEDKLVEYIEFGVENGVSDSLFQYGYIYDKGIAVKESLEKAYHYYSLAAEKKSVKAIVKLGDWFKRGKFVAQNIEVAIKWYDIAAKQNDIDAIEKLIEIYELGIGNVKSDIKALYYVFKLIELDALKGKKKLAYYCFEGIGVEKDIVKGNDIIKEIEDLDKGTSNNLKCFLAQRKLIEMTNEEIINTYMEGIELGNLQCYGDLALFLYEKKYHNNEKYKEMFNTAMTGKDLGVKKCTYIYLKEILKGKESNSVVTVEEVLLIKQLQKLVDKGLYFVINDLLEWCKIRKHDDGENYYKLKQLAFYYNIENNRNRKTNATSVILSTIMILIFFGTIIGSVWR